MRRSTFALALGLSVSPVSSAPVYQSAAVATAHPLATEAGMEMLRAGGNAVDAAVAAAFTLGVVEPHSSGLGGGGVMVVRIAGEESARAIVYREKAPAATSLDLYRDEAGEFTENPPGRPGLTVGTPGTVAGLHLALEQFGTLTWEEVLEPAIRHAEEGYPLTERVAGMLERNTDEVAENPGLASLLMPGGVALGPGEILRQPRLASTLRGLAERGPAHFYTGSVVREMVDVLAEHGGVMTVKDLNHYGPWLTDPIQLSYRGHTLLTLGPPSVGAAITGRALNALESHDVGDMVPGSAEAIDLIAKALGEASTAARAVVGDPAHLPADFDLDALVHGAPVTAEIATVPTGGNTTHLSVIDSDGNAVALTQTINGWFGADIVLSDSGVILNDELRDFTLQEGHPNAPRPGAWPATNMTPTIIFDEDGEMVAVLGSPGGKRISSVVLEIIVNLIDFEMPVEPAVAALRFHPDEAGAPKLTVEGGFAPEVLEQLRARGWEIEEREPPSASFGGAQVLVRDPISGVITGAADPRRDGTVDGL